VSSQPRLLPAWCIREPQAGTAASPRLARKPSICSSFGPYLLHPVACRQQVLARAC
jgi:hypothetical protein